jgi:hypothetical protein
MSFSMSDDEVRAILEQRLSIFLPALENGDRPILSENLLPLWTGLDDALRRIVMPRWIAAFRLCQQDFLKRSAPDPLVVYRGTIERYQRGMSWTTRFEKAKWFAERWVQEWNFDTLSGSYVRSAAPEARLYKATIPLELVLCDVDKNPWGDGRRNEGEIVLDPASLGEIELLGRVTNPGRTPAGSIRLH